MIGGCWFTCWGGVSLGYLCRALGFSLFHSLIIVGVILVGWEIYEEVAGIPEPWTNTMLDLVFGFIGIWLAYEMVVFADFGANFLAASTLLLLWGALNIWGWFAWQAREKQLAMVLDNPQEAAIIVNEESPDEHQ